MTVVVKNGRIATTMEDVPFDELFDDEVMTLMDNVMLYALKDTNDVKYGNQLIFIEKILKTLNIMFMLDGLKAHHYSDMETSVTFVEVTYKRDGHEDAVWNYYRDSGLRWH